MKTLLFLAGASAAGIYFLDPKKGKKRRALFSKNLKTYVEQANEYCADLAERSKPLVQEIGKQSKPILHTLGAEGQKYATALGHSVTEYAKTKNGGTGWRPSARLTGATAGALALYGAGRPGFVGAILRTLSLGFFTRALLASR